MWKHVGFLALYACLSTCIVIKLVKLIWFKWKRVWLFQEALEKSFYVIILSTRTVRLNTLTLIYVDKRKVQTPFGKNELANKNWPYSQTRRHVKDVNQIFIIFCKVVIALVIDRLSWTIFIHNSRDFGKTFLEI